MVGVFFVHSIKPDFGGVETHQKAFINHFFIQGNQFDLIVEKNGIGCNVYMYSSAVSDFVTVASLDDHMSLYKWLNDKYNTGHYIFFLNDPWWIEDVPIMRSSFHESLIIMRSGGNDVEKAPCNLGIYTYDVRRNKYKDFINTLDYIIANSNYSILRLERLGVNKKRILKIRGGVNTLAIDELKSKKNNSIKDLRNELLLGKQYILLYACRFVEFKGIKESLLALSLSEIANEVRIVFLGDGPLKGEIEDFCQFHFSSSQVYFVGVVDNDMVLKYMAASDVVVNCSIELRRDSGDGSYIHTETMGRTMMEAISIGTHIIATDVGGICELFQENSGIGMLVAPNIMSITAAFNKIPQMKKELITQQTDYSWNRVFTEYETIINKHGSNIE